jgi:hypothetical protein
MLGMYQGSDTQASMARALGRIRRIGGSQRYRDLDRLEQYYSGNQHEGKCSWWDDAAPVRERKPCVLSGLPKAAAEQAVRFTLGEGKFPALRFTGSEKPRTIGGLNLGLSKDEAKGLDELWSEVAQQIKIKLAFREGLRRGLAMRTACGAYSLRDGRLEIELLNAKHCEPTWEDSHQKRLASLECRFTFPREEVQKDGTVKEVWYWYRRVINAQSDIVYREVPVEEGDEPRWTRDDSRSFDHKTGHAPAFWWPNLPRMDVGDSDGVALIDGCFDEVDAIDYALSVRHTGAFVYGNPQAYQIGVFEDKAPQADGRTAGTIDYFNTTGPDGRPGPVVAYMAKNGGGEPARKRSAFTVWNYEDKKTDVEVGLLEASGTAAKMVTEHVTDLRARLLESIQVVLVDPASVAGRSDMSAKLLEPLYAPLLALVDDLRECWGSHLTGLADGIFRFLLVHHARGETIFLPSLDEAVPTLERFLVKVQGGGQTWVSPPSALAWGDYFAPTNQDIRDAVVIAKSARGESAAGGAGGSSDVTGDPLITKRRAIDFVSSYFGIDDVDAEVADLDKEREERAAEAEAAAQRELDAALAQIGAKAGAQRPGKTPPSKPTE